MKAKKCTKKPDARTELLFCFFRKVPSMRRRRLEVLNGRRLVGSLNGRRFNSINSFRYSFADIKARFKRKNGRV